MAQLIAPSNMGVVMFCPCFFCASDNFEHCLALPTGWRASMRKLFYWYLCENSREVLALRRVSAPGAPQIVTWTKQTWIKHLNTLIWAQAAPAIIGGSEPDTKKDKDVQELFLLSSTGQIENCTGHLSVWYKAILASQLKSNSCMFSWLRIGGLL